MANNLETGAILNPYQKSQKGKRKKLMKEDLSPESVQDVYRKAAKRTVQTRRVKRRKKKKEKSKR